MTERLELTLSTLKITVEFVGATGAARTLAHVFRHAARSQFVTPTHHVEYAVSPHPAGGFVVASESQGACGALDERAVMPMLEDALYADLVGSTRANDLTMLHGACVGYQSRALVFVGVSGAGKSALARAAVEHGLDYFGDEHVVTDGSTIWGVPRQIHLDAHPEDAAELPWHVGVDMRSYGFTTHAGRSMLQPLFLVPDGRVARRPLALKNAVLVIPSRAAGNSLEPLAATRRLDAVRENFFVSGQALRSIALLQQAYALTWQDPRRAIALLLDHVAD